VNTLQQLAFALDVPIVAFFEADQDGSETVYLRAGERPQAGFAHGTVENLGWGIVDSPFEALVVEMEPHSESGETPIVHTGHELVYCLQGRVLYRVGAQAYHLAPGDSLFFEAHLPHRWENRSPEPARMILVLGPADARDRPLERHFREGEGGVQAD
jgi:quercetin dioxygenase-like cupin family protein